MILAGVLVPMPLRSFRAVAPATATAATVGPAATGLMLGPAFAARMPAARVTRAWMSATTWAGSRAGTGARTALWRRAVLGLRPVTLGV